METTKNKGEQLVFVKELGRCSGVVGSALREGSPMASDAYVYAAVVSRFDVSGDMLVGDVRRDQMPKPFDQFTPCSLVVRAKMVVMEGERFVELQSIAEMRALRDQLTDALNVAEKAAKKLKASSELL